MISLNILFQSPNQYLSFRHLQVLQNNKFSASSTDIQLQSYKSAPMILNSMKPNVEAYHGIIFEIIYSQTVNNQTLPKIWIPNPLSFNFEVFFNNGFKNLSSAFILDSNFDIPLT